MRILGIDSSSLVASVSIVTDDIMTAEYTINYKKTHSQTLLPMIDDISQMIELDLSTIDAIAVAAGPGSFTGLRIGSATAKGLGLALDKPLISIPTLEGLAYNLYGTESLVCPIMDAKRNQVYTGIYEFSNNEPKEIKGQSAISINDLIKELNKFERKVIFVGDGIPVYKEIIENTLKIPFAFAPAHMNRQRAGAVAALGAIYLKKGLIDTAADHKPNYLRVSQAERELAEKNKTQELSND
ncbi:MAG: tRNA (adenosine(37)-N6)-threonylcarbamoyltransferase complex dimerization subunit type 1 TsaB [Clostridiales bacterium]|nr:tRNA (adenosine(37)-N6)-threonylcarbamoyltransferase complex dimerization subunit type 1 TsaB [Clostridiales bacterium]